MANNADQVVFLVHGMGTYEEGWHKSWVKVLEDAYNQYPTLNHRPIDQRFQFVPITYADVFAKEVSAWESNAKALANAGVTGLSKTLTKWLTSAGELQNNFAWTHAADVLLYRLFSLIHERVCVNVSKVIKDTVEKVGPGVQWSIIGHSLGTSAVHDTLARLWANDSIFARDYPARLIAMVANVSRVLEQKTNQPRGVEGDVLLSPIQPGRACRYFLNLEHPLDPFVWPERFHPIAWPTAAILSADPPRYIHSADHDIRGRSYTLDHIHSANIHSFEHYLVSPKAHVPLFRMLTLEDLIPPEEERSARDKFSQFGTLAHDAGVVLKQKLESIVSHEGMTWEQLGAIWDQLRKLGGI